MGIVGSLGAVFSTIRDNHLHDIHVRALFGGAEMAAIKIHASIDMLYEGNCIHGNSAWQARPGAQSPRRRWPDPAQQ